MSGGLDMGPPSAAPSLKDLSSEDRIEQMVSWFFENFEDPAESTPYQTAEGGYLYIWGGPYEASDELQGNFPDATEEEIAAAVEEIESDGLTDWAPNGRRTIQIDDDSEDVPPLDYLLSLLPSHLDKVEDGIKSLQSAMAGVGHNNPPEEFRIPVNEQELEDVQESVEELRLELKRPNAGSTANPVVLERAKQRLSTLSKAFGKLIAWGAGTLATGYLLEVGSELWKNPTEVSHKIDASIYILNAWIHSLGSLL